MSDDLTLPESIERVLADWGIKYGEDDLRRAIAAALLRAEAKMQHPDCPSCRIVAKDLTAQADALEGKE